MLFFVHCTDKPNHQELRLANRAAHLDYARGHLDKIVMGGAMLSDDGQTMVGSGYVFDAPDRAAVEAFFAGDPFVKAGLYESVIIRPYRKSLP